MMFLAYCISGWHSTFMGVMVKNEYQADRITWGWNGGLWTKCGAVGGFAPCHVGNK